MSEENRGLPREKFEPVAVQPIELEVLGTELTICFQAVNGPCEIRQDRQHSAGLCQDTAYGL